MDGYGGDHSKDGIRVLFRIDSETNPQIIHLAYSNDFLDGGQFRVDTGNTAVTVAACAQADTVMKHNVGSFRSHDDLGPTWSWRIRHHRQQRP